ncbi:hypothetical protein ES705_10259 [subsurface metagenome]
MLSTDPIFALLKKFAIRKKSSNLDFVEFVAFCQKYAEKFGGKDEEIERLRSQTNGEYNEQLNKLAAEGKVILQSDQQSITKIDIPFYFPDAIQRAYNKLEKNPELPFPTEESLGLTLPVTSVTAINIKSDLIYLLVKKDITDTGIIRLLFPEDLSSLVITAGLLSHKMLEYSVQKIKIYLNYQKNAAYIQQKLRAIFKQGDLAFKELYNKVLARPGQAVSSIMEPTDFSFRFWAHLASLIIQEFRAKDNMPAQEQSICQAAYLLTFYNVHYQGIAQKKRESKTALRYLELRLRKQPYFFSMTDIYNIRDSKGVPLTRKYSKEALHDFLEQKLQINEGQNLPELIRLKTENKKQYYIHKEVLLPLCLKKIYETAREYKERYVEEWTLLLKEFKKSEIMTDDMAFLHDLETRLKSEDTLLHALLNFDILFLALEEAEVSYEVTQEAERLFDKKHRSLTSFDNILGLERKALLAEARMHLPIWEAFPIIKYFAAFFKRLFTGKSRSRTAGQRVYTTAHGASQSAAGKINNTKGRQLKTGARLKESRVEISAKKPPSLKAQLAAYRKAVAGLKEHFVGKGLTMEQKLADLTAKWNPLYNTRAKQNLVEDVNSMIRDYLRSLKRGFKVQPPDVQRIKSLAKTLAQNKSFNKIKKKEYLLRYIEIYMIKSLGER